MLHLLVGLALLDVELDEIGILLDLVLGDAHGQQLLEQRLPRGVARVDCRRLCGRGDGRRGDYGLRLLVVGLVPVAEDAAQQTVGLLRTRVRSGSLGAKGLVAGVLVGVLLAVVHLLLEGAGLLLVGEGEGGQAAVDLKGVEEDAVLVVGELVVDLLVPQHAALGGRDVDQLQPEGVADQVVGQHGGALQARVGPLLRVRVGDVQLGHGDGMDLVRLLGHGALHRLLVLVGQDRGHLLLLDGVQATQGSARAGRLGGDGVAAAAAARGGSRGGRRVARAASRPGAGVGDAGGGRRERRERVVGYMQMQAAAAHDDASMSMRQARARNPPRPTYIPSHHLTHHSPPLSPLARTMAKSTRRVKTQPALAALAQQTRRQPLTCPPPTASPACGGPASSPAHRPRPTPAPRARHRSLHMSSIRPRRCC